MGLQIDGPDGNAVGRIEPSQLHCLIGQSTVDGQVHFCIYNSDCIQLNGKITQTFFYQRTVDCSERKKMYSPKFLQPCSV